MHRSSFESHMDRRQQLKKSGNVNLNTTNMFGYLTKYMKELHEVKVEVLLSRMKR